MEDFVPYPHFSTQAIHVGQEPEQWRSRAVVPPISMATIFKQDELGKRAVCNFVCVHSLIGLQKRFMILKY